MPEAKGEKVDWSGKLHEVIYNLWHVFGTIPHKITMRKKDINLKGEEA